MQPGPAPAVLTGVDHGAALVPTPWRRRAPVVLAATAVWVALLALVVHGTSGPLAVERPLNDFLGSGRRYLNGEALFFADLNRPARLGAVVVATLALCIGGRSWRAVATLAIAAPATLAACEGLKVLVGRRQVLGYLTFPSGHVAVSAVLATVVVLLARRRGPLGRRLPVPVSDIAVALAMAAVVVVAVSMVVLGDHYVTDTLAGAPIGASFSLAAAVAVDALASRSARGR